MARTIRNARMLVLLVPAASALAALPPLTYPVSTESTEIQATILGSTPGLYGASLTIQDGTDPASSAIHFWGQNPDGTFFSQATTTVPYVVAHLPVFVSSGAYHDVFYLAATGTEIQFGFMIGGGVFDPSIIASTSQDIAPPKGGVLSGSSNFNASSGGDVAVLYQPERLAIFVDDGAGGMDPAYSTVDLPPGTDADSIVVADVTGDGLPDVLAGSTTNTMITIMENTTSGGPITFSFLQAIAVPGYRGFTVGDLDGNGPGFSDVVAIRVTGGAGEVMTLLNSTGPVPFGAASIDLIDPEPYSVTLADLQPADGFLDAFVACRYGPGEGTLDELRNDGTGDIYLTGQYFVASSTVQNVMGADRFVAVHDGGAGSFTIFPMDLDGSNVSPADGIMAGAGPDPAAGALVLAFRGDGTSVATASVTPYAAAYGVNVGNGNIDGTETLHAKDELLTGPGPSPAFGPHVKAFRRDELGMVPVAKVNFYAYGTLRAGVNVSGPDLDVDESDEIVTGAGPNPVFGPHVRGFNYDGVGLTAIAKVNFFAYGTLKFGVEVGGGFDGENDDFDEILTGPGPGPTFGAQVRGFDYDGVILTPMAKVNFVAMPAPQGYGCNVTGGDVDSDSFDDIQVGRGPGAAQASDVAGFQYDGVAVQALPGFAATPFATVYGARVAHGDLGGDVTDEQDELVVGAGEDPAADATVEAYVYDGFVLIPGAAFATHQGTTYGVNPAGVFTGF